MVVEDMVAIDQLSPEELDSGVVHVGGCWCARRVFI